MKLAAFQELYVRRRYAEGRCITQDGVELSLDETLDILRQMYPPSALETFDHMSELSGNR